MIIEVPHVKGLDAFRDPTHKNFFTIATMDYFTNDSGYSYYSNARFEIIEKKLKFKPKWLERLYNLRPQFTEHFLIGYFKPHIHWELKKVMKDIKRDYLTLKIGFGYNPRKYSDVRIKGDVL